MTSSINRDKMLERAAKTRAIIIAYLNGRNDYSSAKVIYAAAKEKFEAVDANYISVRVQLRLLAKNDLILSTKIKGREFGFAKKLLNSSIDSAEKTTKVDVKIKPLKEGKVPAYKIDVVKGQKRVRITIDDVMFDIGVVSA